MTEYLAVAFNGGQSTGEHKKYAYLGIISSENKPNLPQNRNNDNGFISLGYILSAVAEDRMEIRYKGPNLGDAENSIKGLENITNNSTLLHCLLSRAVPNTQKNKDRTQLFKWEVPFRRD